MVTHNCKSDFPLPDSWFFFIIYSCHWWIWIVSQCLNVSKLCTRLISFEQNSCWDFFAYLVWKKSPQPVMNWGFLKIQRSIRTRKHPKTPAWWKFIGPSSLYCWRMTFLTLVRPSCSPESPQSFSVSVLAAVALHLLGKPR